MLQDQAKTESTRPILKLWPSWSDLAPHYCICLSKMNFLTKKAIDSESFNPKCFFQKLKKLIVRSIDSLFRSKSKL